MECSRRKAPRALFALFALAAALLCAFALIGCGSEPSPSQPASVQQEAFESSELTDKEQSAPMLPAATDDPSALQLRIEGLAEGQDVSIAFVPLGDTANTASAFSIGGETQRPSASLIKLTVLAKVLDEAAQGAIALDDEVDVRGSDIVGGTGVIQNRGAGSYSVRELARLMIAESDNTAANVLINLVGMDAVNDMALDLGLDGTGLARFMMDEQARAQGRENMTCADDVAQLLTLIAKGELVDGESSALAEEFLIEQRIDLGLASGVPEGITVGHKTGSLDFAYHDAGIVYGEHPYVLVVMTQGLDQDEAERLIASAASIAYEETNAA